jgi:hypothetical protein
MKEKVYYKGCPYYGRPLQIEDIHTMKMFYLIDINIGSLFGESNKLLKDVNSIDILLYKNGVGQYDLDNNLVNEFACKYDCIRELKMSDKTLAKALDKNVQYNGFYYKSIGNKLKMI